MRHLIERIESLTEGRPTMAGEAYWKDQFSALDKALPRYNAKKIRDWNKVRDHYRASGFPGMIAGIPAHWYNEYRSGQMSLDDAARNCAKEMERHKRVRFESLTEDKYDPRRLFGSNGISLLMAFQVLSTEARYRNVSDRDALRVIGKLTGLKLPGNFRKDVPKKGGKWELEDWLDWLAEWAEANGQMEWYEPYAWAVPAAKRKGFYPDEELDESRRGGFRPPKVSKSLAKMIAKSLDKHWHPKSLKDISSGIAKGVLKPMSMSDRIDNQDEVKAWAHGLSRDELIDVVKWVYEIHFRGRGEQYAPSDEYLSRLK